jgi:hypothetical protein
MGKEEEGGRGDRSGGDRSLKNAVSEFWLVLNFWVAKSVELSVVCGLENEWVKELLVWADKFVSD